MVHADVPRAELFLIGSVLQRAAFDAPRGALIAGCGLAPNLDPDFIGRVRSRTGHLDVRVVRGPLTRNALDLPSSVGMGDGALLLAETIRRSTVPVAGGPRRGLIVAHYRAAGDRRLRRCIADAAARLNARVVFTGERPESIVDAVCEARWILSTSLHGVVVADMANKPVLPVAEPGRALTDFRFDDYSASVGRPGNLYPLHKITQADVLAADSWPRAESIRIADAAAALRSALDSWYGSGG